MGEDSFDTEILNQRAEKYVAVGRIGWSGSFPVCTGGGEEAVDDPTRAGGVELDLGLAAGAGAQRWPGSSISICFHGFFSERERERMRVWWRKREGGFRERES